MHVTRQALAAAYAAPAHHGVDSFRLQGGEESRTHGFWVGLSVVHPDGGATASASPCERIYVVLDGELEVTTADGAAVLHSLDSVHIEPGEERTMRNLSRGPTRVLVIMGNAAPGS